MNALNPVLNIGDQFVDMIRTHEAGGTRRAARERAGDLLHLVGIERSRLGSYAHELSGGMRQRVVIAMALALEPELIIMDEPTTALDVVVQREILQEIEDLQQKLGFAVLFITHDLSLLVEFSRRIGIMYAAKLVEFCTAAELFTAPCHPYTVGLMSSFPALHGERRIITGIPGAPPDLANPPSGCRFHPRCPSCCALGMTIEPSLQEIAPGHLVACHLYGESA
jgi:peptide/nickel transport system ATP-binding protein